MKRKFIAALGVMAMAGCGALAQNDAPLSPPSDLTNDPLLQPTATVLLNSSYYDATRAPIAVGALAPDFQLPLAKDCPSIKTSEVKADALPGSKPDPNAAAREIQLSSFLARKPEKKATTGKNSPTKAANPTVLIFWAFWCDTWKDATRDLKKLRPQIETEGAGVLCVSVDASQQPVARRAFGSGDIWFPVVIDSVSSQAENKAKTASQEQSAGEKFGVRRVPTVFVLDSASRIRARFEGFPKAHALLEAIRDAKQPLKTKVAQAAKGK